MGRGRSFPQLLLVAILGVSGGIYIWKPLFLEAAKRKEKGPDPKVEQP
nr:protein PIGBOS1-like [Anolis sagrei ordinatus]